MALIERIACESCHFIKELCCNILIDKVCLCTLNEVCSFLFHGVSTGKIRALITEQITVYFSLLTQDDAASRRTELRLVVIRAAASGTGAGLGQRALADAAVQPAWGDHIRGEHFLQTSSLVPTG